MAAFRTAFATLLLFCVVSCRKSACGYKILPDKHDQAQKQTLVIALGGFNAETDAIDTVEIYSVTSNSHRKDGAALPGPRNAFGSSIFNNTIYVVGGWNGSGFTDTFWSYNITQNKWNANLPNVPSTVAGSAAVEVGGRMYVLGGVVGPTEKNLLQQVYAYETRLRKWYTLDTSIPQTSMFPCAVAQEKHLYYMPEGGLYHSDDGAKTWEKLSSPSENRSQAACVAVGKDAILLAGGANTAGENLNSVEIYNITTDQWKTVASMNSVRLSGSAELMLPSAENVLICGGKDEVDVLVLKECEVYDWQNDKWSAANFEMNEERSNYGLFVTQANV